MVALADDWRLEMAHAFHFLSPDMILARYRLLFGDAEPYPTYREMLVAVVDPDAVADDLSLSIWD
jgi:hypothetical protein